MAAVIGLAHGLGMTVICEGVETADQDHHLTQLGCDSCQGFHFASPMPASNSNALIQHRSNGRTRLPAPSTCQLTES